MTTENFKVDSIVESMEKHQFSPQKEFNDKIKQINEFIKKHHDMSLIKPNEQPNENTIYHLYDDGEIMSQKGGWAYGNRSMFSDDFPIIGIDSIKKYFIFPLQTDNSNGVYPYAVMTSENCTIVRNLMNDAVFLFDKNSC